MDVVVVWSLYEFFFAYFIGILQSILKWLLNLFNLFLKKKGFFIKFELSNQKDR